jgi:hypothetical protein
VSSHSRTEASREAAKIAKDGDGGEARNQETMTPRASEHSEGGER